MLTSLRKRFSAVRDYLRLTPAAKAERRRDRRGLPTQDPGIDRVVEEAIGWLCRAQDHSASHDGGVARHYSLLKGWSASYPETTGYIIPTMFHCAQATGREELRDRAKRMLDWLVSIQLPEGAFQGGTVDAGQIVPTIFDTGQILQGLAAGVREFGDPRYHEAMSRAANWLVKVQAPDGSWPQELSPFALPGAKAYDTHVAWGLLEAARVEPDKPYAEAALANVRWALTLQQPNGWLDRCCLQMPSQPLTHTLGYALRGVLEAYRFSRERGFLDAARRTADGLLTALGADGFLPGRLDSEWRGTVSWSCLTGTVQIAACWLMLYQDTGEARYPLRDAAFAANQYVRRTIKTEGPPDVRGGIKGSFRVDGGYGTYQYLNWACKFFVDANLLERAMRENDAPRPGVSR